MVHHHCCNHLTTYHVGDTLSCHLNKWLEIHVNTGKCLRFGLISSENTNSNIWDFINSSVIHMQSLIWQLVIHNSSTNFKIWQDTIAMDSPIYNN